MSEVDVKLIKAIAQEARDARRLTEQEHENIIKFLAMHQSTAKRKPRLTASPGKSKRPSPVLVT
jgi:hypothetical protein